MTATLRSEDTLIVPTKEAAERAGVSFRQADYWVRRGILAPTVGADGYGSGRRWSPADVAVLRAVGAATVALRQPHGDVLRKVADVAREVYRLAPADTLPITVRLDDSVTLTIDVSA